MARPGREWALVGTLSALCGPWLPVLWLGVGAVIRQTPNGLFVIVGHLLTTGFVAGLGIGVGPMLGRMATWPPERHPWRAMVATAAAWGALATALGYSIAAVVATTHALVDIHDFPEAPGPFALLPVMVVQGALLAAAQVAWYAPLYVERQVSGRTVAGPFHPLVVALGAAVVGPVTLVLAVVVAFVAMVLRGP
ncbi:MAG: hypothetical protein AAF211_09535 [Myxococcota bacterium]